MMKLLILLVLLLLSYVTSFKCYCNNNRNNVINNIISSSHSRSRIISKRSTEIYVIDQVNDASYILQDNANAFIDGFERSFSGTIFSRLVGGIIGNIVAGIALTTITVAISKNLWNDKKNDNNIKVNDNSNDNNKFKTNIPIEAWGKLLICIAIDFLGDASYVIPGIGELEDIAWAPLSAFLISKLFNNNVLTTFEFVKELAPGTDIIPIATCSWLLEYVFADSFISNSLKLSSLTKNDNKK